MLIIVSLEEGETPRMNSPYPDPLGHLGSIAWIMGGAASAQPSAAAPQTIQFDLCDRLQLSIRNYTKPVLQKPSATTK